MADKLRENAEAVTALQAGGTGSATAGGSAGAIPAVKAQDRRAQQRAISQGLRQFFDTVASEPIPDEFVELLKRIDEEQTGRSE